MEDHKLTYLETKRRIQSSEQEKEPNPAHDTSSETCLPSQTFTRPSTGIDSTFSSLPLRLLIRLAPRSSYTSTASDISLVELPKELKEHASKEEYP